MSSSLQNFLKSNCGMIVVIFLLGLLAYGFTIGETFKTLDDQASIINNENIKSFSHAGKILTSSYFGIGSYYRPLVMFSYLLEYHFFGLNPAFYYLTNLIIHLATAILVFFLIGLILEDRNTSFFVSLLFAVHPVQWEAVSNVSGRSILLSAFFVIAAFVFFCLFIKRQRARGYYFLSILCFICALLSKESALIFPLLLTGYVLILDRHDRVRKLLSILPFFLLIAVYFFVRRSLGITILFHWRTFQEAGFGFLTFLRSVITYLRIFAAPIDLHFDRSRILFNSFFDREAGLTLLFFMGLALTAVLARKKISRPVLFFSSWFFIELIPVSQIYVSIGIQPGYVSTAEHFLYIPSIGMFALWALTGRWVYLKVQKKRIFSLRLAGAACIAGVLGLLLLTTVQQNIYSQSEMAMLKQTLRYDPYNTRIRESYGFALAEQGLYREAELQFRKVLAIDPFHTRSRIALGKALCDQGKCWEGIKEYEKILDAGDLSGLLGENLELSYKAMIKDYTERIAEEPGHPGLHYSLGVMFSKTGRIDEAIAQYEKAVSLKPDYKEALFNLAASFATQAKWEEAAQAYERMLSLEGKKDEQDKQAAIYLEHVYQKLKSPKKMKE